MPMIIFPTNSAGMADTIIGEVIFSVLLTSCDMVSALEDFEITCGCSSRESCDIDSLGRWYCGALRSCGALDICLVTAAAVKCPSMTVGLLSSRLGFQKKCHAYIVQSNGSLHYGIQRHYELELTIDKPCYRGQTTSCLHKVMVVRRLQISLSTTIFSIRVITTIGEIGRPSRLLVRNRP